MLLKLKNRLAQALLVGKLIGISSLRRNFIGESRICATRACANFTAQYINTRMFSEMEFQRFSTLNSLKRDHTFTFRVCGWAPVLKPPTPTEIDWFEDCRKTVGETQLRPLTGEIKRPQDGMRRDNISHVLAYADSQPPHALQPILSIYSRLKFTFDTLVNFFLATLSRHS